jgi:CYTH domain-containing protein
MYLSEGEFRILAQLAVKQLSKIRYSVPPFGIDLFDGALKGLILAEVEFEPAQDADALTLPSFIGREVSTDNRFSGGQLARASRQDVEAWLSEYGVGLSSS